MDYTHLYQTRIEKTFDEDLDRIIVKFKELLKQGKTGVTLINYYQGLPISFSAKIMSVDNGVVDLDLHPQQAVAIARNHYTFIRCNAFPHDICASVQYINPRKNAANVNKFFFVEIMAEQRKAIRLVMEPEVKAAFTVRGAKTSGIIGDISMGGLTVRMPDFIECDDGFETLLQFGIPNTIQGTSTAVTLPARHFKTRDVDGGYLYVFFILPDKNLEQQISKYIFQRQVELVRELKDATP